MNEAQDCDRWEPELIAAGWIKWRLHVWKDPQGNLYRGPYGAWAIMDARRKKQVGEGPAPSPDQREELRPNKRGGE